MTELERVTLAEVFVFREQEPANVDIGGGMLRVVIAGRRMPVEVFQPDLARWRPCRAGEPYDPGSLYRWGDGGSYPWRYFTGDEIGDSGDQAAIQLDLENIAPREVDALGKFLNTLAPNEQ